MLVDSNSHVNLDPPKAPYGTRLLISRVEEIARTEPDSTWVSIPADETDLTKPYRNISFREFVNGANHAANWLLKTLPAANGQFPSVAYVGPKDLRYPLLAIAAGKIGYVLVLPSGTVTTVARHRILQQTSCQILLHAAGMEHIAAELLTLDPTVTTHVTPEMDEWLTDVVADPVVYDKTWDEVKYDPWIVFHTSGTTGFPKTITYSQSQFAVGDALRGLERRTRTPTDDWAFKRLFIPMPFLHMVGMFAVLSATTFGRTNLFLSPSTRPPTPDVIIDVLKHNQLDGAVVVPALLDALVLNPTALGLLRQLEFIQYAGAPLSLHTGRHLTSHSVRIVPLIGSTDVGGYYIEVPNATAAEDWDYVSFQPHAGAVFEPRVGGMHELVFVRNARCALQPMFHNKPASVTRFETKDLWTEHPTKKGQWKIVGRADDYIFIQNGDGLYVAPFERILQEHPLVQTALVGGQSKPRPIALLELVPSAEQQVLTDAGRDEVMNSLQPFIDRINENCHDSVKFDPRLVVFVDSTRKPLPRTVKDTVARNKGFELYAEEVDEKFRELGYQ